MSRYASPASDVPREIATGMAIPGYDSPSGGPYAEFIGRHAGRTAGRSARRLADHAHGRVRRCEGGPMARISIGMRVQALAAGLALGAAVLSLAAGPTTASA